ncbi:MAG: glycosyltransferase [Bacteroidales bacterium]|nr:glycosyltransferase [Bacteroidales bacterium]
MKTLLISTSDRNGGAAIACSRIFNALRNNGVDVKMLVRDKISDDKDIFTVNTNFFRKVANFFSFCFERVEIAFALKSLKRKKLFAVSTGRFGVYDLVNNPLVKEADVINIHWASQGMLSIKALKKLISMKKKIVFTMHDMHYFTGICHYTSLCTNFTLGCGNCFYISNGSKNRDLSNRFFKKKISIPNRNNIKYIACSNWLADIAKTSKMMIENEIFSVPNPIDTKIFRCNNVEIARKRWNLGEKKVILCGAANFSDPRKGYSFLIDALKYIHNIFPKYDNEIELLVFGNGDISAFNQLPYNVVKAGYINSEVDMAQLYSAGDVLVTPSLEDNLPNTIMESLSCGTPCVAFNVGGISQMIEHKVSGWLAKPNDFNDLANGILYILFEADYNKLTQNSRLKVETEFSEPVVAMKYNEIFRNIN